MEFTVTLDIAYRSLGRNKLRSGLTALGIVIGVAAVVAMVSVGKGAQEEARREVATIGANMIFVGSGSVIRGGMHVGYGAAQSLVNTDSVAIERECSGIQAVTPGSYTSARVVFGSDNWTTVVTGTGPEYFEIRNWPVAEGASFTQADVSADANVAVIGETVKNNLFGANDPIGETIRINSIPFRVIGLLTSKGSSMALGSDQDDSVVVPITTLQKKITGQNWLRWVMVSAASLQGSYATQREIIELLRARHRIRQGQDDDFFVRNLADMANFADSEAVLFTTLLASIASISLVVGGIGIMNIMMVSVTERTREVGIRMAAGASDLDIQRQFLVEATMLSFLGGVAGILLGIATSYAIPKVLGWEVLLSPVSVIAAVVFATAVGIFFGYYPARKASRMDPIEALRYE